MYTVLTVIHVVAALIMIGVILLQQGKGADMGAVFGGSSQTLFGSSGAGNFLTRTTAGLAAIFFITSLALAYGSARRVTTTIFDDAPLTQPGDTAPAPEGAPAPQGAPPAAAPAPQAAAPVAEGNAIAVVEETGKESAENLAAEAKEAGAAGEKAVADAAAEAEAAAAGAGAKVEEGAKEAAAAAESAAQKVEQKADAAAEAAVGAEAKKAPAQVDPIPPVAAP